MISLDEFKAHLNEISAVYDGISKKIEDLIVIANELASSNEKEIKALADRIEQFLARIRDFIILEKSGARKFNWSSEKKKALLALINEELTALNGLIQLMKEEKKKPLSQLIVKIFQLNQEVNKIIQREKILLRAS